MNRNQYKYNHSKEHYDRINFYVPKGYKEKIKAVAAAHEMSMSEYLFMLVRADMKGSADDEQD